MAALLDAAHHGRADTAFRGQILHGVSLSLGGTEPLNDKRLARLASLAERFGSPLVSEHVAFCRAGGMEAGHLLPVPRTRAALRVLTENIRAAQAALPVPLAVENIAALVHVAGGVLRDGIWHDTHAHPVSQAILAILAALAERAPLPGVMLERDDAYPSDAELAAEVAAIQEVLHEVHGH